MGLTDLPPELLEPIITHTLPEGFESLALSCKSIYALCRPFLDRHNQLRLLFRNFDYSDLPGRRLFPFDTALDVIARIAVEPVVARYIRTADFNLDSQFLFRRPRDHGRPDCQNPHVVRLLADSPYLAQAGLDPKQYYGQIDKELNIDHQPRNLHYSQHAATFLLTLLPNIETLRLPRPWRSIGATEKLVDAIVCKAKEPHLLWSTPSLAQLTKFGPFFDCGGPPEFPAPSCTSSFLALPKIQSFMGTACSGMANASTPRYKHDVFGESLEHVNLGSCCIDGIAITDFLKHTPRLKTLRYSHRSREGGPQDWDFCNFVTAVERGVGHHLEDLSISTNCPILPGKTSMRGYQCLRKLQCPLDFLISMMEATVIESRATAAKQPLFAEDLADHEPDHCDLWIGAFIPASLSRLSLETEEKSRHDKALEVLFDSLAARKRAQLPALALAEIFLERQMNVEDGYKGRCDKWIAQAEKAGVVVQVDEWEEVVDL